MEIQRSLPILVLSVILLGIVSTVNPVFAANANLFVSAENSQFDNYMSGPQVIEVVVIDSDINDTDEAKGEPDVTVNGKELRMVQAVDGNWYGYFADRIQAQIADQTIEDWNDIFSPDASGTNLDFGTFCDNDSIGLQGDGNLIFSVSNSVGVAVPGDVEFGGVQGTTTIEGSVSCGAVAADTIGTPNVNVVREEKDVNVNAPNLNNGQVNIDLDAWPFIQLYNITQFGNVTVQYAKGGGNQTTILTFDTVEAFAGIELDKAGYQNGEDVFVTITDLWLNIDPTDEDSWTFSTVDNPDTAVPEIYSAYQVFDENGSQDSDAGAVVPLFQSTLTSLMCEDNCKLLLDPDVQGKGFVVTLQDNTDSQISGQTDPTVVAFIPGSDGDSSPQNPTAYQTAGGNFANGGVIGNVPITITEQGPNSGVFGSYDESNTSNIVITNDAVLDSTASVNYNGTSVTILAINPQPCQVPSTENWIITQNCELTSSATAPANVTVQNNSLLTVPSGITLTISSSHNLTIQFGSGVLIKDGGTLQVNS